VPPARALRRAPRAAENARGAAAGNGLEAFVLRAATAHPDWGQFRIAASARDERLDASPSGVRAILKRHGLETAYKRIAALGPAVASTARTRRGVQLTARQLERYRRAGRTHAVLAAAAPGDREGRNRARRHQLLTVAAEVFARRGYESATLKEIADAAGLLPGSMYHYFRSKEDLFLQVVHEGFRQLNSAIDAALRDITDPWRRLETVCSVHLSQPLVGNAIDAFTALSIIVRDRRTLDRRLIRERDSYEKRFRAIVEALPLPARIDRSMLRLAMLGALNWTNLWYKPGGRRTREDIAREFVALVRR